MNPQIGAALIAVGGALVSIAGVVASVFIAASRTRKQKRGELAVSALSDYVKAVAQSATVRRLRNDAASLSNEHRQEQLLSEAHELDLQTRETAAHAKTMLLAFADSDALQDLARWDRAPGADDLDQRRVLLSVVNAVRRQIDTKADAVHESIGLGLMFGWPDEK